MRRTNLIIRRRLESSVADPNKAAVRIGADVVVRLLRRHGNEVILSISAPADVAIVRGELGEKVDRES